MKVTSSKVNFVFDKKAGVVTSYKVGNTEYFNEGFGIQPNFWRAPNDNDYGSGDPQRLEIWEISSRNFNVTSTSAEIVDGNAIVKADYKLPAGNQFIITYKIYPDGTMNVATLFTPAHLDGKKIEISGSDCNRHLLSGPREHERTRQDGRSAYRCTLPSAGNDEPTGIFRSWSIGKLLGPQSRLHDRTV